MVNIKKTISQYYLYFMMYAVIGWLYEVFLEVVVYGWGFRNRGVLFGPYLPIYGVGALIFIIMLRKLKERKIYAGGINITPFFVFLGIVVIATTIELIGSYIMEWTRGSWMWNYERFAFDFQGRIALNPSIRFGIGGMIFIYILQPLFEKMVGKLSDKWLYIIAVFVALIFVADVIGRLILK